MTKSLLKFLAPAALALAAATGITAPAMAKSGDAIVVLSEPAMKQWTAEITEDLERQLYFAAHRPGFQPVEGVVQMRFTLDAKGKATGFKLVSGTGHKMTDRLAKRALSNVNNFDEAPVKDVMSQTFQANIIFADSEQKRDILARQLAASERERLASGGTGSDVITIAL